MVHHLFLNKWDNDLEMDFSIKGSGWKSGHLQKINYCKKKIVLWHLIDLDTIKS